MKALSIKQPWLHALLKEGKDIENRTWQAAHRGWIALHALGKPAKETKFPGRCEAPNLKDFDSSANLPLPTELAAEIVGSLEAAPEEFRAVEEALSTDQS